MLWILVALASTIFYVAAWRRAFRASLFSPYSPDGFDIFMAVLMATLFGAIVGPFCWIGDAITLGMGDADRKWDRVALVLGGESREARRARRERELREREWRVAELERELGIR